jgi:hypothetical protein
MEKYRGRTKTIESSRRRGSKKEKRRIGKDD